MLGALHALEPPAPARDVLSDVLRTVRLSGSMLFLVDATVPWRSHAPDARTFASQVMPQAQHLVSYHIVVSGQCWAGLRGEPLQPLAEGDGLVVPHGDAYVLASHPDAPPSYGDDDAAAFFRAMAAGELPSVVTEGGGGEHTSFICGFLGCDARPFNPILWSLPRAIHLQRVTQPGDRLSHLAGLRDCRSCASAVRGSATCCCAERADVRGGGAPPAGADWQRIHRLAGRAARPADLAACWRGCMPNPISPWTLDCAQ
jgi:hypothetical protein